MDPLYPQGEKVESVFISYYPEGAPRCPVSHDQSGNQKVSYVIITGYIYIYSLFDRHMCKMWLRAAV